MGRVADDPDGLDLAALTRWFAAHVPDATGASLAASLIAGGRSNLTYSVTDGDRRWVLRRPPLGHVLATAHDMQRESTVLRALRDTDVPVPLVIASCDDETVTGAPFYVMEHVDGRVLRTPQEIAELTREEAARCSQELVRVLAALHRVDYERVGLGAFGRPEGFLARNLARWGKQWESNATRPLPGIDELRRRLEAAVPESGPPAVVHGDYRLDNTMLATDDPGTIVAVLDWEMSTVGDPLTDVGLFLLYWGQTDGAVVETSPAVRPAAGWWTRDQVIDGYAALSGRDVEHLDFYEVFATYKLAIIVEGINARFQMGKTRGEGFDQMGPMVAALVEQGLATADRSSMPALRG